MPTHLKLGHILPNLVHNTGDIVPFVDRPARPLRPLPVLRVAARHNHLDDDLVVVGGGDRRLDDLRPRALVDDDFEGHDEELLFIYFVLLLWIRVQGLMHKKRLILTNTGYFFPEGNKKNGEREVWKSREWGSI